MTFFIRFDPLQLLQGDASKACNCLQTRLLTTAACGHEDHIAINAANVTQVVTSKLFVMLWTKPYSILWVVLFTWLGAVSSESLLVCLPGHPEGVGFRASTTFEHHLQAKTAVIALNKGREAGSREVTAEKVPHDNVQMKQRQLYTEEAAGLVTC